MKHFILLAAAVVSLFASPAARAAEDAPAPKPFPVGVWYEGGVGAARQNLIPDSPDEAARLYDQNFKDLAAHNINTAVVPNTPPAHHKVLLDAAHKHGLKLIVELDLDGGLLGSTIRGQTPFDPTALRAYLDQQLTPIKSHPAFSRVQLLDEPAAGAPVATYAKVADVLRAYDPAVRPFCCLAGVGHTEEFARVVKPDVIAFDHYPIGVSTPVGDPAALRGFADASSRAVKAARGVNADCYAVIQCHDITGHHRLPKPEEIRCMTHASLATGNRGIFWFLYQTEWFDHANKKRMGGLVDEHYNGDARWEEVGKLARLTQRLAPVLATLAPATESPAWDGDVAVYKLRGDNGKHFFYAVNFNCTEERTAKLRGTSKDAIATVTAFPREDTIDSDRDGQDVLWETRLAPGAGTLFRLD